MATEPPPVLTFSATCTQWEIYDSYIDHYRRELVDQDAVKVGLGPGERPGTSAGQLRGGSSCCWLEEVEGRGGGGEEEMTSVPPSSRTGGLTGC